MKKYATKYYTELKTGDENYETLKVAVNEEVTVDLIKISFNTDNWRSRKKTIELLEKIIEEIKTL